MVLGTDNEKSESEKEKFRRRRSFPMKSVNTLHYSSSLSFQILDRVNKVLEKGSQSKSPEESIQTKESPISPSPTKSDDSNNESGYSEYSSPSRIIKSTTFTVRAMENTNSPNRRTPEPKHEKSPVSKNGEEDGKRSMKRSFEKQRKNRIEYIPAPSPPQTISATRKDETREADMELCDSGAESASPEKDSIKQQRSTEIATLTTPVKNGKGKFGGLKKRKSLDKSSRKSSLRSDTAGDESQTSSSSSLTVSAAMSTPTHDSRRGSSSPPLSLPLSFSGQESSSSSYSIVEYEGAKKVPKKANIDTMRAMGLTEERKPKLTHRASFKMWKRSALQYIKSHTTNVNKGKMYQMDAENQATKSDDAQHYKNETPDESPPNSINGDNNKQSQIAVVNNDLSPMDTSNCSPMYKCYPNVNTSPYSDEKTRKWRRVRRAFSELYPTRCIDSRIADDEGRQNDRKSEQKGNRKSLLSMSNTSSQFDLRTLGNIEIDAAPFTSKPFNTDFLSLKNLRHKKDAQTSDDNGGKFGKNTLYAPTVTSKSEMSTLPPKSNGLCQTAPHRIDFQKYMINPNRENCRRSSMADLPSTKNSPQNDHGSQKEPHSKSLESSRTEAELKKEIVSPTKEQKMALEKILQNEEFGSISRDTSCSTFQLITISPDSTSTSSTQTTKTSTSRDGSSIQTSQISSCTTSSNMTTSSCSSATTSSDDNTISPTFEEYARAHGGMNFGMGRVMHGGEMPASDHHITSRGVSANLSPINGRSRRSSITIVNRATSPMNIEPLKEDIGITLNKEFHTAREDPQNITRSSNPEGFRKTQEISCRLLSPGEATATRNTYMIPSKSVSPGLVTTRYLRNTKCNDVTSGKTELKGRPALAQIQKSQSDDAIDKKGIEIEKHRHEDLSKDTSISDSNVSNDQESVPMPPPRRRLKENTEGLPSPSILKKNTSASSLLQIPGIQDGKGQEKKEPVTKIPTSRRNTNNGGSPIRSAEKSASPVTMRKVSKPGSPLPKRDYPSRPIRNSKSTPSSPDLNANRGLRIAGGLPSSPEFASKRASRTTGSHLSSSPELSNKNSRVSASRQSSPEPAISKRSRITKPIRSIDKDDETMAAKDLNADLSSMAVKTNSGSKSVFPEAAPLKNSRMTTSAKQAKPDTVITKNNRIMTPKKVNVTTGLQLVSRPVTSKVINTEPSKNSRIPVCKSTRPDVIPKKSGRLAMNRLVNPNTNTEKCLRTANNKTERPVSTHSKYSHPRLDETFIPSTLEIPSEQFGTERVSSCEVEVGPVINNAMNRGSLDNSRLVCEDLEAALLSQEVAWSPDDDSVFSSPKDDLEKETYGIEDEIDVSNLGISLEEINQARIRNRLDKTFSIEAFSGSPPETPTKVLVRQKVSSPKLVETTEKVAESPPSLGDVKKQNAFVQTSLDEISSLNGKVVTIGASRNSMLKQDMAAQTKENEVKKVFSSGVCGIVPVMTRHTPHQIKMGGAALRARSHTELPDGNGPKRTTRSLDARLELASYNEHVQQLMVVEEGQARLYDLKPASCQNIQLLSPSELNLGSSTSTDHSSTDPYLTESSSMDRCLGSLVNSRYRYQLSNSMAGGLDAIAQSNIDQSMFNSSASFEDNMNLENIPRRRRAASLSNIESPRKANDKKNRKRSRLSTFLDKFNRKKKPTIISDDVDLPTHFRMIGRILEMCLDGTRIIELTQPPHGLCGIYMARIEHTFGHGIYVSRFCDGYPAKMFAGLLAIGDQILEINGIPTDKMSVEECHDMVASRDTLILRVMPDPTNYTVSTLPH